MSTLNNAIRLKPVFKKNVADDRFKFQPLPKATGAWPYHLSLEQIVTPLSDRKMVFHMVGDTGSVRLPEFQHLVAGEMLKQVTNARLPEDKPLFLFHLGDVVYKFGEAEEYYRQFFEPYKSYPNPVFAIPGNHDSDINPENARPYQSLDAFTTVFCDTEPRSLLLAGDTGRKSMVQPNVYWTLQTPLAHIIGLYGNVPRYGVITDEQKTWFTSELREAGKSSGKALILCLHHAPYSADVNHSSSKDMINFLEAVFNDTGVKPDIVFSGHVHNYQRFSRQYADGTIVPFIVSGGGGYDELHAIASLNDPVYDDSSSLFDHVRLEKYCDHRHGFLKIAVEKDAIGLTLNGEYYSLPHSMLKDSSLPATLTDQFTVHINRPAL